MYWASLRCKSQRGTPCPGDARRGAAGFGLAGRGNGCRRQHGGATLPAVLNRGQTRRGHAGTGGEWLGQVGRAFAWSGNS
jgi:hypothetical protein